jgi:hypothetical protein
MFLRLDPPGCHRNVTAAARVFDLRGRALTLRMTCAFLPQALSVYSPLPHKTPCNIAWRGFVGTRDAT